MLFVALSQYQKVRKVLKQSLRALQPFQDEMLSSYEPCIPDERENARKPSQNPNKEQQRDQQKQPVSYHFQNLGAVFMPFRNSKNTLK